MNKEPIFIYLAKSKEWKTIYVNVEPKPVNYQSKSNYQYKSIQPKKYQQNYKKFNKPWIKASKKK